MLGQFLTVIHVFISGFLILIVLLQQGKGADAGATFGGGGQTFFGASGADNLLTKVTTLTAIVFMCTSILLATSIRSTVSDQGELMRMLETTPVTGANVADEEQATGTESETVGAQEEGMEEDAAAGEAQPATDAAASENTASGTETDSTEVSTATSDAETATEAEVEATNAGTKQSNAGATEKTAESETAKTEQAPANEDSKPVEGAENQAQ